ncbi:MAG: STT3 domain-containing protein [Promethearchaeota archaeon]
MPPLTTRIKRFFQENIEKSRSAMKINAQNVLISVALFLAFFLAVFIRLAPIFNNVYLIKAFDPWVQYKVTNYIVENGLWSFLNWHDYQAWYPEGIGMYDTYIGLPLTNAIFYWILSGLGFPVSVYDVCFFSPAFMGGLTTIVIFFLGKEVLDKKTGLLAAFFLALSPGYMQRTVAGFYDNETIGVFSTLLSLLFFVRALKKGSLVDGIMGGFSFGYLSLSWGGYTYTALLVPLFTIVLILLKKYSARLLLAYTSMMSTGLIIHAFFRREKISNFFHSSSLLIPILVLALLPFVEYLYRKKQNNPVWYRNFWKYMKKAIIPGVIIAAVVVWYFGDVLLVLPQRFMTILNPLFREQVALVASVGEHMPAPWSVFYYNTLIPLLFVVPGIYFAYKRGNDEDVVLVIFTLTLYYFTGSMIRIILLFAPAISLMGSYGISQIFNSYSTLIQKSRTPIARRKRRKQTQVLDKSSVWGVYLLMGLFLTVQVVHSTDIAAKQMPWSEIVAGGQFHDWEEAFTWMRTNLSPGTVVISWWDYGYWATVIGNVTTVNDNATLNQTRIGLVGMAMMMNDELEAAKILKGLKADYVLVYYGHLVSGLGGDEGKWPWMVKICNDKSEDYANKSKFPYLDQSKWYKPGEQVFNYADYINESNGLYDHRWFESQLVRMMFYEEPLKIDQAKTQLQYWAAREISGDGQTREPRRDTNGKLWTDYFEDPSYFDFKVLRKAFFSSNTTVKIYKVDYTAIESDFQVENLTLYDNGYGNVLINNTGSKPLNITNVRFTSSPTYYEAYSFEGTLEIQPNQTKSYWFNTERTNLIAGDIRNVSVKAETQAIGKVYSFEREGGTTVKNSTSLSIKINRTNSFVNSPNLLKVSVENTGNESVLINNINVDGFNFNQSSIEPLDDTYVIPINESRSFSVLLNESKYENYEIGDSVQVNVSSIEGAWDATLVCFNDKDSKLSYISDYITLKETDLILDDQYIKNFSLVNFSTEEKTAMREFMPVDFSKSVAYTNGTIKLVVQNTGNETLGLDEVRINGTTFNGWNVIDGSYFFDPGETRTILINKGSLALDALQDISIYAIDKKGEVVAGDHGKIKTIYPGEKIKILDVNSRTLALTNETFDVTVKNVGDRTVTLDRLLVNGTIHDLSTSSILRGSLTLNIQESCIIHYNYTGAIDFNSTEKAQLTVETINAASDTVIINTTINPVASLNVTLTNPVDEDIEQIYLGFHNNGTEGLNVNLTIGMVKIKYNSTEIWYKPSQFGEIVTIGSSKPLGESGNIYFTWTGPNLVEGDVLEITVYSLEGGEDTLVTTVV